MENQSDNSIFVPDIYSINYRQLSDTAGLDGVSYKKYNIEKSFYYSKFSDPIVTSQELVGLKYDSVKTEKSMVSYFQFSPPKIVEIKPRQAIVLKIPIKLSKNIRYLDFSIYKKNYILNTDKNYDSYHSYDDFISFEKNNSYQICIKIIPIAE